MPGTKRKRNTANNTARSPARSPARNTRKNNQTKNNIRGVNNNSLKKLIEHTALEYKHALQEAKNTGGVSRLQNYLQLAPMARNIRVDANTKGRAWDFYEKITPVAHAPYKGVERKMNYFKYLEGLNGPGFPNAKPATYASLGYRVTGKYFMPTIGEEGLYIEKDGPIIPVKVVALPDGLLRRFKFERLDK